MGIIGEMIEDFTKDNSHLRMTITDTYLGRVCIRRRALGEGDELAKYCGWGKESQAEIE